jgi:hypothetical protein
MASSTPWFRFSLGRLLILVAVAAVVLGLLAFPLGLVAINWLYQVLIRGGIPTLAAIGAVFGKGELRAFSIGAAVANIPLLVGPSGTIYGLGGLLIGCLVPLVNCAICGGIAVACRRGLVRRDMANDL